MKKKIYFIISIFLLIIISSCSGYKPIFSSTDLKIEIVDHSIKGNKKLGNKIYSQLYRVFKSGENNSNTKNVSIILEVSKDKKPTVKNSAGKILEYKIIVNSEIIINDFITGEKILDQNFDSSLNYKVQNQYSDTLNLENRSIENLVNNIYQKILLVLSQKI